MDDQEPPDAQEELRRRMRAAMALAGLTVKQLAARIDGRGYSDKTLNNMLGDRLRPIEPRDFPVLAQACGLTPAFFTIDFSTIADDPALAERVEALERQMATVSAALFKRSEGDAPPSPPGELLQSGEGRQPKPSSGSGGASGRAADAQPGSG